MAEHPYRRDGVAVENGRGQFRQTVYLHVREGTVAELMPRIDQLDTDGAGIDVCCALP